MSPSGHDAYDSHQKKTETVRETDAMVLDKAATFLKMVKERPDSEDFEKALEFNLLVWTTIQAELTMEGHPLPDEIRANLISLSIFVDKQTFKAMADRDPKQLDSMININRNIAMGLREGSANESPHQSNQNAKPIIEEEI